MSNEQRYCIYTGNQCTNCNRCQHPQQIIIKQKSNKSIIALLIILIIILLIILMPLIMADIATHFLQKPVKYYDISPTYVSKYESFNSYIQSDDHNYDTVLISSTSNDDNNIISTISETYDQISNNSIGENYNSMG